jgi:hypothetical protein
MILRLTAGLDYSQDVVARTNFYDHSHNFSTMPDTADGVPGDRRAHITPQTAIDNGFLTLAQYNAYDHYCIVRDPVDRFISTIHLALPGQAEGFNVGDLVQFMQQHMSEAHYRPQVEWLTLGNINALPFSDYENSVNTILTAFGAPIPAGGLPRVSRSHWRFLDIVKQIPDQAQRGLIRAFWSADSGLST